MSRRGVNSGGGWEAILFDRSTSKAIRAALVVQRPTWVYSKTLVITLKECSRTQETLEKCTLLGDALEKCTTLGGGPWSAARVG